MDEINRPQNTDKNPEDEVSTNDSEAMTALTEAKLKPKKKSTLWKWLVLLALLLGLGILVAVTPATNQYLPDLSRSSNFNGARSVSPEIDDLSGRNVKPSISGGEAAFVSYGALTLAVPIMIAVLTLLTFINALFLMTMMIDISNIKNAIVDIYNSKNK